MKKKSRAESKDHKNFGTIHKVSVQTTDGRTENPSEVDAKMCGFIIHMQFFQNALFNIFLKNNCTKGHT